MKRDRSTGMRRTVTLATAIWAAAAAWAVAKTPAEMLKAAPQPVFAAKHTLPPLSRWGWQMSYETALELCEHWGYALEIGAEYSPDSIRQDLANTNSGAARMVRLSAANPAKYPLALIVYRGVMHATLPEEAFVHDAAGKRLENVAEWKTVSPLMPDTLYQDAAAQAADVVKQIRAAGGRLSILLNGGEYGLNCRGHSGPSWEKDAKVVAAKGDADWDVWIGQRKAHYEMFIADAVRKAAPDRDIYLYYHFGAMPGWTEVKWVWDYAAMRAVADRPGQMFYYAQYDNSGWTGKNDMLSNATCAYQACLKYGDKLAYHWLCSGWGDGPFSDHDRYMGFLKCLYNTGMLGGVAGYFSYPVPPFAADQGDKVPHWLEQMMVLGHAHALFSHLETFIRDGELLPGPEPHRYGKGGPAYEFPTGDATARVLVRKHEKLGQWLVTAWAAEGPEREVTVDVPELGPLKVLARPAGSVYRVTAKVDMQFEPPKVHLELLDPDPMRPSASFAAVAPGA